MDDTAKIMLFITAIIATAGIAFLVAKTQSIEQRMNSRQTVYVPVAQTSQTTTKARGPDDSIVYTGTSLYF